ncbi:hypothetical protein GCM10023201_41100 [Actinomycetospora corticicola]|uniref:Uncharacterized protein n=1 Tax=Actinomycetospora corticicola TaxID=663602 RepID=A0A7Y9J6V1_9PSEU|nr:hypothetical protein [Actinomycetospora corticicola]NYD36804.1 hypothetical protein [Actinomycetospora corticicola]
MQFTWHVTTVAGLREFLARCEQLGVSDDAPLHARTGFDVSQAGPPLKQLTVRHDDGQRR